MKQLCASRPKKSALGHGSLCDLQQSSPYYLYPLGTYLVFCSRRR